MMRRILLVLVLLGLFTAQAQAHKVSVFAVTENGFVTGEGYFSTGAKAQNSTVELRNAKGDLLAQGMTGADGTFRIALPSGAGSPLTVVLNAGEGHRDEYTLTDVSSDEKRDKTAHVPSSTPMAVPIATPSVAPVPASSPPASPVPPVLDEARLSALMEAAAARAVEEKTAPMRLELAKISGREQGTRLQDIVGGLGWIVGLVGLAAWFKRPRP